MEYSLLRFVCLTMLILFECIHSRNEAEGVEKIFHDLVDKLGETDHFEYLVHLKLCDESTLDGDIGLSEEDAKAVMECEQLDDDQTWNETEGNLMCIEKAYPGRPTPEILYNIICNKTKDSLTDDVYTKCMSDYYWQHFGQTKYHKVVTRIHDRSKKLEYKIKHMQQLLKGRHQIIKCYNKSLGFALNLDYEQIHHNYEFENEIFLNCYALNDEKSRNDSFSVETEAQKVNDFIKCYQLLSSDCYSIINNTYLDYFNKYQEENLETNYQKFIITKMSAIYELISRCQTQEYAKVKANDYYSKQKEIFAKLNDCQVDALNMTEAEKETLQQRQYFYVYDF